MAPLAKNAPRETARLLKEYTGHHFRKSRRHHRGLPKQSFVLEDSMQDERLAFLWTADPRYAQLAQLADRAARMESENNAHAVVLAPYVSEQAARAAEKFGLDYLDLSGNARIRTNGLLIWVRGQPNRYKRMERRQSPFGPRGSRIARLLLLEPHRWWTPGELIERSGLDPSTVSRLLKRLTEDRLIERVGETRSTAVRAVDPYVLLDAWADDSDFSRHHIVEAHLPVTRGSELIRRIARKLDAEQVNYAATGLAGAWLLDRFASFRLGSFYLDSERTPEEVADLVGARLTDRGANLQLIVPNDQGVFDGVQTVDNVDVVSPVQAYVDLLAMPERANEAAEHLRPSLFM